MSAPLIWVIGAGGLLGSHLQLALSRRFPEGHIWQSTPAHFSWSDPVRLAEELSAAVANFAEATRHRRGAWSLFWCAGKGTVSSPPAALQPEWSSWARLLDLLAHHLIGRNDSPPGYVFLASSAGGIYGGNDAVLLTEDTTPQPNSAYGAHKQRMEETLRNWIHPSSNVSCFIGRISTLYGPGQDLRKPQGIISHLSRCLIYRRQVSIYVPLDTRRDYFFAADCADQIAACLSHIMNERPRLMLKIFASERLTSLAQIVGIFLRITKQHSLIAARRARDRQPISLKFRSRVWRDLESVQRTDLATGIHVLHAYQLKLFQRGLLEPPADGPHITSNIDRIRAA